LQITGVGFVCEIEHEPNFPCNLVRTSTRLNPMSVGHRIQLLFTFVYYPVATDGFETDHRSGRADVFGLYEYNSTPGGNLQVQGPISGPVVRMEVEELIEVLWII